MFRTRHLLMFAAALSSGVGMATEPAGPKVKGKPNRLAQESSPYLLQHAHNPVDWFPWGQAAFAKAKKEGKLVFLSIGYSSCHWCHVMERESFANPAVAAILNEHFVCIKVDREERPDVDEVYMTALQEVLGLNGGWPLSMFLMPDGKPIFGGTYWPPDDRKVGDDTIDGFKTVLNRVIDFNKTKPKDLAAQADKVAELTAEAMSRGARLSFGVKLDAATVKAAADAFDIDPEHGGFGFKPAGYRGTKFPRAAAQLFLLRQSRKPGNENIAKLLRVTLGKMAAGGIFDQVGGGFHRYSTERTWTVPHFEKMLYDNALLLELYADAYRHDRHPEYRRVARLTTAFLVREMTSPAGAFYSALDADSEGREGAFYVWTVKDAATVILDATTRKLATDAFGLGAPNFEENYVIPTRRVPLADLSKRHKLTEEEVETLLGTARDLLFADRSRRPRPFRDEKVLAGWNGLMIAGFARAGEVFQEPAWVQTSERAADFILSKMRTDDGRLLRAYAARPGGAPEARVTAMLEDYAFVVHGLLTLHDTTGKDRWLTEAKRLTEQMVRHHGDPARGGFFTTPHDGEKLFARGKDYYDGATPSGNGMAARNLVRLWQKTKDEAYRAEAEQLIRLFGGVFHTSPTAAPLLADALDGLLESGGLVVTKSADALMARATPRQSADVVELSVASEKPDPAGEQAFTLTLTVAKPWHIYANPVGNPDLLASATTAEIAAGGKALPVNVEYPDGHAAKDGVAGEYRVYDGTVRINGRVKRGDAAGPLEVRVRVTACDDETCLLPSVLTATLR